MNLDIIDSSSNQIEAAANTEIINFLIHAPKLQFLDSENIPHLKINLFAKNRNINNSKELKNLIIQ